jgi:hypothetical protein
VIVVVAEPEAEEPVEFSDPTGTFQIAPASDWDNLKLPKKSALKGAGPMDSPPVTDSPCVHFSHVETIESPPPPPPMEETVQASEPKSSPKATPVAAPRPKLRGGLV